jgi:hypothetical protein
LPRVNIIVRIGKKYIEGLKGDIRREKKDELMAPLGAEDFWRFR